MYTKAGTVLLVLLLSALAILQTGCDKNNRIVARVNHRTISEAELNHFVDLMRLCNPDLDRLVEQASGDSLKDLKQQMLYLMIEMEVIRQAVEKHSLEPDPVLLDTKTRELTEQLIDIHYQGSKETFDRQCKRLNLEPGDLSIIPRFELKLQALFNHIVADLTEEELLQLIEEVPELLQRAAAVEVQQVIFEEEFAAQLGMEALKQGVPLEQMVESLAADGHKLDIIPPDWIAADTGFIDPELKEQLFKLQAGDGLIIDEGECYRLYWVIAVRPDQTLTPDQVWGEAEKMAQYILYQDYYNSLWSESRIELFK